MKPKSGGIHEDQGSDEPKSSLLYARRQCTDGGRIMRDGNIGSIPVVIDQQSRELVGVITDRDLCCSVVAALGISDPEIDPLSA